jgi:hypothetical protein
MAVDDGGAEGGRVGVVEIVKRDGNVEAMAEGFRTAVNGVVFGSGNGFEIARVVTLESFDESYA